MQKLSALIFSRNDLHNLELLIKDVYDLVDQLVIVDSSNNPQYRALLSYVSKNSLKKIDVFRTIALGYPDPLRGYGLSKCKNEWVLYIDIDERLNEDLKANLPKLINSKAVDAYAIKRYEEVHLDGSRKSLFSTWQIRLYRKDAVTYKGLLHEQPIVSGKLKKLNLKYCMNHILELRPYLFAPYNKFEKFDRFSYSTFNGKVMSYFAKLSGENQGTAASKPFKALPILLRAYQKLKFKGDSEEISTFDYFVLFAMRDFVYAIKNRSMERILKVIPNKIEYIKRLRKWRSDPDGDAIFAISNLIEKKGIIKYLKLDEEATIRRLNAKYGDKKQGIELLMKLLKDKYYGRYP
ncbi:MAG: hypothetical protein KGH71_03850 [Candidatus Micrarchaeota archaeon]|nr:hypothetical protein [Candidatus Micrarchaeota archaeon]